MKSMLLLTGGSGLIGTALQKNFSTSEIGVVNLVRQHAEQQQQGVPWEPGSSTNPLPSNPKESLQALEGCTYAIHLAGANLSSHRWTAAYRKTILDSRVDSSNSLVEILSRLKQRPKVLVCASATGIYGDGGKTVLTERSPVGAGFLPEVCHAWEQASNAANVLGVRVVHLRFGVVLARHGGALAKLLPLFKAGLGGQLGDGRQWVSWVTLEDVVRSILFALKTDTLSGACNVVSPNPVTNRELTRALGKAVHRPAPWIVPAFALKAVMGQMAQDTLLASTRALPERLSAAGFNFASPELATALQSVLA